MKKFILIPVFISFLAFTIQLVDQFISPMMPISPNSGFGWIAFQAWAMYFLAGATVKGALKTLAGYGISILASIGIMLLGGKLAGLGSFGVPTAIFIIVIGVIYLEKTNEYLSFIPAIFVGAGVFFGMMSYVPGATFSNAAIVEIIYCIIGLFYGFLTVSIRNWYENRVGTAPASK